MTVSGTSTPAPYYVQVTDDKLQSCYAYLLKNGGYTTQSPDNPKTGRYQAPTVTKANTKVTITVKATDEQGHPIGMAQTVTILVSP